MGIACIATSPPDFLGRRPVQDEFLERDPFPGFLIRTVLFGVNLSSSVLGRSDAESTKMNKASLVILFYQRTLRRLDPSSCERMADDTPTATDSPPSDAKQNGDAPSKTVDVKKPCFAQRFCLVTRLSTGEGRYEAAGRRVQSEIRSNESEGIGDSAETNIQRGRIVLQLASQ